MKKCGLYLRVSTDRQAHTKDGSLDTQLDRLQGYVNFRNSPQQEWAVEEIYREEGRSGKDMQRPELQRMLGDVQRRRINLVLCTKLDRITRSLLDFHQLHQQFEQHEAEFVTLDENFDTSTPTGKAMLNISLVFAELERERTSERTREKMQWRAEQGLWNSGQVLGYDCVDGRLVANEGEAKLVRLIFEKYLELGSLKKVADFLNDNGYRTKAYTSRRGKTQGNRKFYLSAVKAILVNPLYIGKIRYKEEIYDGQQDAVIDEALWEQVQAALEKNLPRRRNFQQQMQHVFILQGLVRCGFCDSYMTPKYSTGRNGLHFYYQCTKNSHFGKQECEMRYVPAAELERVVLERLKAISMDEATIQEIVERANSLSGDEIQHLESQVMGQENQLRPIQQEIANYVEAIGKGFNMTESVLRKLQELEAQQKQLEGHIAQLRLELKEAKRKRLDTQTMRDSLMHFSQIIEVATPEEQKALVPRIVESVTFTPTEIEIALFEELIETGLLSVSPSVNQDGDGALEFPKWLPRPDSNQRQGG